jgi:leucyl aminopeptidase
MAKKKTSVAAKSKTRAPEPASILGFDLRPTLGGGTAGGAGEPGKERGPRGEAVLVGAQAASRLRQLLPELPVWLVERALRKRGEPQIMARPEGPLWLLVPNAARPIARSHAGLLEPSGYGAARDIVGLMMGSAVPDYQLAELRLRFVEADADEIRGALVGVELGLYRFKSARAGKPAALRLVVDGAPSADVSAAGRIGNAVNLARHLVNSPPADLNPASFAAAVEAAFAGSKTTTVDVWEGERLARERLGLLSAVGQGAVEPARLVHIRYRPQGKARFKQPLAFVGKGVTFDTGGLDIKDAASMRLMKKDMGGAASVFGLAYWVEQAGLDVACDFYLALAENSVSERAFHPGDVITSRAGLTVEIDNTDAEGRLVMADAFDVAVKADGKDAPHALIDLSTLTGAMRIALGTRIAGYFATHDGLAEAVARAGQMVGEPTWRMPLFQDYWSSLKSTVADFANSSGSRFGGAITAALFLQRFVGNVPWVHFDLYAWTEGGVGGCAESGGNGQGVQLLAAVLEALPADFFG